MIGGFARRPPAPGGRAIGSALPIALLLSALPARAEPPMQVDDAATMDRGGMKIEGAWRKDGATTGPELDFGFSPLQGLELTVFASDHRDGGASSATTLRLSSIGAKWVPGQSDMGWSFGLAFAVSSTHISDDPESAGHAEHEIALAALATWRGESGQALHLNLGGRRANAQGGMDSLATWGVGYEHPLADRLQLTGEIFGQEGSSADKAIGLRYRIAEGLKVSAAAGGGNGRTFGQIGFAWEF